MTASEELTARPLVLLKLGGSLLTDKEGDADAHGGVIRRVADEVARGRRAVEEDLVVGHGSGSFGHVEALRHGFLPGPVGPETRAGVAATRDAAARLHRLVVRALLEAEADPASFAPSSALVAREGRLVGGAIEPLERALDFGLLPVTYGDVVLDRAWGASIVSTEEVLWFLIRRLVRRGRTVRRVLWAGATEGIYDADGELVQRIDGENLAAVEEAVGGSAGRDVTGGMLLRLRTAWRLARSGVESLIFDGTVPGRLERALTDFHSIPGTLVTGRDRRPSIGPVTAPAP